MKKRFGFTLAEVLITLAIIGVVAAMTIPSVIVNTNQQEFKTGLRKAVSVLNSSINMNLALEGETPYDNADLFGYLQQHMSIMKSAINDTETAMKFNKDGNNAFYTTDGFRFEFPTKEVNTQLDKNRLHESTKENIGDKKLYGNGDFSTTHTYSSGASYKSMGNCGALGLSNVDSTTNPPCVIMVDVNGDRKPNPKDANNEVDYIPVTNPNDRLLKDIFTIMITDKEAIPFGITAQKAMYQAQK